MTLVTITVTENRLSRAWYVKYPLDSYALGPYRFDGPVEATIAVEQAQEQFGQRPYRIWPDGETLEVEEYKFQLDCPEDDEM